MPARSPAVLRVQAFNRANAVHAGERRNLASAAVPMPRHGFVTAMGASLWIGALLLARRAFKANSPRYLNLFSNVTP